MSKSDATKHSQQTEHKNAAQQATKSSAQGAAASSSENTVADNKSAPASTAVKKHSNKQRADKSETATEQPKISQPADTTPQITARDKKGVSPLLWVIALLALFIALGGGWYSYSMQQQEVIAYQAGRELVLERINQLERQQERVLNANRELQKSLAADNSEMQQSLRAEIEQRAATTNQELQDNINAMRSGMEATLAGMRSEITDLPGQLGQQLLEQLITQAELLHQAKAPVGQIRALLNAALRLASITDASAYNELIKALQTDLGTLTQAIDSNTGKSLTRLDAMRQHIRTLEFVTATRPSTQESNSTASDATGLMAKLYRSARDLLGQLVVVRRHAEAISVDLSVDQFNSIKLLIDAALAQAQLALLLDNAEGYATSLTQVKSLTQTYLARYDLQQFVVGIDELARSKPTVAAELGSIRALTTLGE